MLILPNFAYAFPYKGKLIDIAVVTEREKQWVRVFRLRDLEALDGGDLVVFNGDVTRAPMGIALYPRQRDKAFFIFVRGKDGPVRNYLGQHRLFSDPSGIIRMLPVQEFGNFLGQKEIESIVVDEEAGYIYYSDE